MSKHGLGFIPKGVFNMAATHRILVWNPHEPGTDGVILNGPRHFAYAEANQLVTLPYDVELYGQGLNALHGYSRRGWGSGYVLSIGHGGTLARRSCPLVTFIDTERKYLHWAARISPIKGESMVGTLRLTTDSTQRLTINAGLSSDASPIDVAALDSPDRWGGYIIRGKHQISSTIEGYLGLSLYGTARGIAVEWVAVTQSHHAE